MYIKRTSRNETSVLRIDDEFVKPGTSDSRQSIAGNPQKDEIQDFERLRRARLSRLASLFKIPIVNEKILSSPKEFANHLKLKSTPTNSRHMCQRFSINIPDSNIVFSDPSDSE